MAWQSIHRVEANSLVHKPSNQEKGMFVNQGILKAFVNRVLRELHQDYESTYSVYAERLATLTAVIGEFHVSRLVLLFGRCYSPYAHASLKKNKQSVVLL